jgi:hypothetical protein
MSEPTPLQPKEFFRGIWRGPGELIPAWWLRWFAPCERINFSSEAIWLSETVWLVKDRMEFSSGRILERRMFSEIVAPDRLHVTADDMPGGADILLHEHGFRFTPYWVIATHRGVTVRLRGFDECTLDEDGFVHDTVRMYFCGLPVVVMKLGPIRRHSDQS